MDNIAEGFSWGGNKEFIQLLSISNGSYSEVRSQSFRSFDFKYITETDLKDLPEHTDKLSRKISSLISHLKQSRLSRPKYK